MKKTQSSSILVRVLVHVEVRRSTTIVGGALVALALLLRLATMFGYLHP